MSSLIRRLFGSSLTNSRSRDEVPLTQQYLPTPRKHPPVVGRPREYFQGRRVEDSNRTEQNLESPPGREPKVDGQGAKRHASYETDAENLSKRIKLHDGPERVSRITSRDADDNYDVHSLVCAGAKRDRSPNPEEEVFWMKRARTDSSDPPVGLLIFESEHVGNKKDHQSAAALADAEHELSGFPGPTFPATRFGFSRTLRAELVPRRRSHNRHLRQSDRNVVRGFSGGRSKAYLRSKRGAEDQWILYQTPCCPSGQLRGIGTWPASSEVGNTNKTRYDVYSDALISEEDPTSVRKSARVARRDHGSRNDVVGEISETIKLRPLYTQPETKKICVIPTRKQSLRAKIQGGASRQSKLTGLWGFSIGPNMGPVEWTS